MRSLIDKLVIYFEKLNQMLSEYEILKFILETFNDDIPIDIISYAIFDHTGCLNVQLMLDKCDLSVTNEEIFEISSSFLSEVIFTKKIKIIDNYSEYAEKKDGLPDYISENRISSEILCPLLVNDACVGVMIFSNRMHSAYKKSHAKLAAIIAHNFGVLIERNIIVNDLILASISGFAKLVEAKDSDTGMHLERMQNYSKLLALRLSKLEKYKSQIDRRFIDNIYKFSPLHDIGKVGIADGILLKPAKLTHEEFEVMKKHTVIGAEVLKKASQNLIRNGRNYFDIAIQITECHHEKYDGSGYPYGISGDNIPLAARIVAIADVFDALTSKRVYKNAMDISSSLEIIKEERGKSFDPDVVDAFFEDVNEIIAIYEKYRENIDLDRR